MCIVYDSEAYAIMQAANVLETMSLSSRRVDFKRKIKCLMGSFTGVNCFKTGVEMQSDF